MEANVGEVEIWDWTEEGNSGLEQDSSSLQALVASDRSYTIHESPCVPRS